MFEATALFETSSAADTSTAPWLACARLDFFVVVARLFRILPHISRTQQKHGNAEPTQIKIRVTPSRRVLACCVDFVKGDGDEGRDGGRECLANMKAELGGGALGGGRLGGGTDDSGGGEGGGEGDGGKWRTNHKLLAARSYQELL
jgi:hypothetical protein